jgi:hypothetical protein
MQQVYAEAEVDLGQADKKLFWNWSGDNASSAAPAGARDHGNHLQLLAHIRRNHRTLRRIRARCERHSRMAGPDRLRPAQQNKALDLPYTIEARGRWPRGNRLHQRRPRYDLREHERQACLDQLDSNRRRCGSVQPVLPASWLRPGAAPLPEREAEMLAVLITPLRGDSVRRSAAERNGSAPGVGLR